MKFEVKFFYCESGDGNLVASNNKGVNYRFCKDCMMAELDRIVCRKMDRRAFIQKVKDYFANLYAALT